MRQPWSLAPCVLVALLVVGGLAAPADPAPSPKLEPIESAGPTPRQDSGQLAIHGLDTEPFTVAESRKGLQAHKLFNFALAEVPAKPRLEVFMTVVAYACALKPGLPQGRTSVLVNGKAVAEWSFAYPDNGKSYRTAFDIDPKLLRVGENELEIIGYRCSYGNFEVVRFHGIALTR